MIPTKTLRERMTEAIDTGLRDMEIAGHVDDLARDHLVGRDPIAGRTVTFWASLAWSRDIHRDKLRDAERHCRAMDVWHQEHG